MMFTPTSCLYMFLLFISTLLSISSYTMVGAWLGLEVNLMSFIPLLISSRTFGASEGAMKYFFVQALSSLLLLTYVVVLFLLSPLGILLYDLKIDLMIMLVLFIKLGAAPFYHWFPGVVAGVDWGPGFILMTWQKVAPLILVGYFFSFDGIVAGVIMLSAIIGGVGGINQMSLRKMMAYSSINHMAWMIMGLIAGLSFSLIYFLVYMLTSAVLVFMMSEFGYYYVSQVFYTSTLGSGHVLLFLGWLSFGGLPPFIGFFPKWMIISVGLNSGLVFIMFLMVMMSLLSLFYYLRVSYIVYSQSSTLNFMHGVLSEVSSWWIYLLYFVMLSGLLMVPLGIQWV
uniref:NADH-ubiquinone oxidoreductase chain 2 n=1 Tax=Takobia yixiani TaxID=743459 RepID=X1W3E8_9INSE|nr:NADH dehydrogenase subunit 2 [Takobia yixiani]